MLLALCMLICSTAAAEQSFTPGTYEAVGQGKNGHVAVSVTFSDTAVTDIQIGENEETPGICENVFNTIPQEILDFYKMYRPAPLVRAYCLEKKLDTPAKIYYKFEGSAPEYISRDLRACAEFVAELDEKMLSLNEAIQKEAIQKSEEAEEKKEE